MMVVPNNRRKHEGNCSGRHSEVRSAPSFWGIQMRRSTLPPRTRCRAELEMAAAWSPCARGPTLACCTHMMARPPQ